MRSEPVHSRPYGFTHAWSDARRPRTLRHLLRLLGPTVQRDHSCPLDRRSRWILGRSGLGLGYENHTAIPLRTGAPSSRRKSARPEILLGLLVAWLSPGTRWGNAGGQSFPDDT